MTHYLYKDNKSPDSTVSNAENLYVKFTNSLQVLLVGLVSQITVTGANPTTSEFYNYNGHSRLQHFF
jgi:hypothetical protein